MGMASSVSSMTTAVLGTWAKECVFALKWGGDDQVHHLLKDRVAYQEATEFGQDADTEFKQADDAEAWVFKPISLDQAYVRYELEDSAKDVFAVKVQHGSAWSAHQN